MSNHRLQATPIPGAAPPQVAGAVDLSALKGAAPKDAVEANFDQQLVQAQLMCQCGERMRGESRIAFIRKENAVPTPAGGMPALAGVAIHSLECSVYAALCNDPMLTVVAVRRVTTVEWPDEPLVEEEAQAPAEPVIGDGGDDYAVPR